MREDGLLEYLLEMNGVRFVIDQIFGLWVKFDAKRVTKSIRPQGIKYSMSLHNRHNQRIMGFDNAHEIEYGGKQNVAPMKTYDHWHSDENDEGKPYSYQDISKLFEDFWIEVDKKIAKLEEVSQ